VDGYGAQLDAGRRGKQAIQLTGRRRDGGMRAVQVDGCSVLTVHRESFGLMQSFCGFMSP